MKELVKFEQFRIIKEAEAKLEAYLDRVVEQAINEAPAKTRAGALFQNPVKFTKIKNNAKKYQQALVQKALNDVNFEKKKQAAGGEADKDKMAVLTAANKAKNQALTDTASAISDRMTQLATSPGLQAVKSLAISKAKVAAAETALKAADEEESAQLKIKIKKLNAQAAKAEKAIKDFEKEGGDESQQQSGEGGEKPATQEMPAAKEDKAKKEQIQKLTDQIKKAKEQYDSTDFNDKEDEGLKRMQAIQKLDMLRLKKAELEEDTDKVNELKADIEKTKKVIKDTIKKNKDKASQETSEPAADTKALEDAKAAISAAKANYDQVKDGDDEGAKIDAKIKFKQAQQKKAKLEGDNELYQGLGDDIGELMTQKQKLSKEPTETEATPDPLDKEIADQEDKIAAIKNKAKDKNSPLASPEVLAKALEPEENKLKELKGKKSGKKEESAGYIGESFTDKFRRLMKDVNV